MKKMSTTKLVSLVMVLVLISTIFSTFVLAAPSLTSSISATPIIVQPGDTITVTMTVTNTGTESLNNVAPSALTLSGTGTATLLSGPLPAPPVSIAIGASQTFTWTYTAGPKGTDNFRTVKFTGNASGTGAVSGTLVSSTTNSSNDVIIGYCDYTQCYTAPFGKKTNLNLNQPSQYCFPSADDGGIQILLGPFYGTATLCCGGQQIEYLSSAQSLCSGGQDWIIFAALDNKKNPRGYFKICINLDCSRVTFPIADPDSASVCTGSCVNIPVLNGDTYTAPLSSITIVDPPTGGTASVSGTNIYYCAHGVTPGDYNFNYSITDAIGYSNKAKVTITVKRPLLAVADSAATCGTTPVTINVLTNDKNASGATATLIGTPVNGGVTEPSEGNFTFTPTTNGVSGYFDYNLSNGACWSQAWSQSLSSQHLLQLTIQPQYARQEQLMSMSLQTTLARLDQQSNYMEHQQAEL